MPKPSEAEKRYDALYPFDPSSYERWLRANPAVARRLNGSDRAVLVCLCEHAAHDTGRRAWPSNVTIARQTGLCRDTVIKALDRLQNKGFIAKTGERPSRHGSPISVYQIFRPARVAKVSKGPTQNRKIESGPSAGSVGPSPPKESGPPTRSNLPGSDLRIPEESSLMASGSCRPGRTDSRFGSPPKSRDQLLADFKATFDKNPYGRQ